MSVVKLCTKIIEKKIMSLNAGNYVLFFKMSLILVVKNNYDGLYDFLFLKKRDFDKK